MQADMAISCLSGRAIYSLAVIEPRAEAIEFFEKSPSFLDRAARHLLQLGCAFIFYSNVRKFGLTGDLDPSLLAQMENSRSATLQNGLYRMKCFYDLATILSAKEIRFMPLKGVSLLLSTYHDESQRSMVDLDIMIAKEDFTRCRAALEEKDFRMDLSHLIRGVMVNQGQECVVRQPDGGTIDLHYRLFPWYEERYLYKLESSSMLLRSQKEKWHGINIHLLKKEDEFHYLLFCAFSEGQGGLRYYLDADAIVKVHGVNFDWMWLSEKLRAGGLKYHIRKSLGFMSRVLGTPFPVEFLEKVCGTSNLRDELVGHFLGKSRGSKIIPHKIQRQLRVIAATNSMRDAFSMIFIYFKWQLFKLFGFFKGYFKLRNNPVGL